MSWWDSKGLANFATKALKTAQQKIDKALDIREDVEGQADDASFSSGMGGDDFWGSYLTTDTASPSAKLSQEKNSSTKKKKAPTEDELFASLSSPSESQQSANVLAEKARSLQDKMKASTKFTSVESKNPPRVTTESVVGKDRAISSVTKTEDDLSPTKKGAPLKLGMKLGTKKKEQKDEVKKDDCIPGVSLSSVDIEEKLKREKEAEMQLLEMLGDGSQTLPKTPLDSVATLHLEEGAKNLHVAALGVKGSGVDSVPSASLFDMSGSSIMQDSHCEWGDDVSLSILSESTVSVGDVTRGSPVAAVEAKSENNGAKEATDDVTDHKDSSDQVVFESDVLATDVPEQISEEREQGAVWEISPGDSVVETKPCAKLDIETEDNKCDNIKGIPVTEETEIEIKTGDDGGKDHLELDQDSRPTNVAENDQVVLSMLDEDVSEKNVAEISVAEKSHSFMMDDSQTSSSVDDLSSSNRTLTTDDLQALDNSQELSQEAAGHVEPQGDCLQAEAAPENARETEAVIPRESEPPAEADRPAETDHVAEMERQSTQECVDQGNAQGITADNADVHKIDSQSSQSVPKEKVTRSSDVHPCSAKHAGDPDQAMVASQSSQLSTSSSFVKTMLEEAMVESVKDNESSHCDSTSHSSSDMVRIESGQNSGQTSADELETATSSDIEIISHVSTPTPNGGNAPLERTYELSGLRHGFSKISRRSSPPSHRRTDSDSSGFSMQSKNGEDVAQETKPEIRQADRGQSVGEAAAGQGKEHEAVNNPYETEKLLKESKNTGTTNLDTISEANTGDETVTLDRNRLLEKLAEMAEVLEAREKKLVELSRSNMDLTETNGILRSQLQQLEEVRETELTDLNQLTDEFTARISEAERKLNAATKERDALKKHSQEMESLLTKRSDASSSAQKMLLEKDQQITELMEEGEKLSKQQLQSNNIIKKLRSKEKENEVLIKSQKEKLETQKTEMERLKEVLDNKCDVEKQQTESINQLQAAVQRYEKEVDKYRTDLEESSDKTRSLQAALDNSYKEIAELHKANVMKASQVQEEKLSTEMQAKQELQIQLDRQLIQAKQEQEALLNQIEDLRLSMTRLEKEGSRREDILRQEISDLQQRLQEAEDRNQELSQGVTAATRPLLRQIENLQSTYTAQASSYERVEKNLTERLNEAQINLATAQEKERVVSEQLMEVTTKLKTLESQLSSLRQEKSKLLAQLEMEKTKVEVLEDAKNNFSAQREALQLSYDQEINQLKKEKLLLENQYEMEKIRVEAEKKKAANIAEQLRDKELQLSTLMTSRSPTPKDGLSRDLADSPLITSMTSMSQSMSTSFFSTMGDEAMDKSFVLTPNGSKTSLYESLRNTGAASLMESLQSQLKQQGGEIVQLQNEIRELERTRESMAREMVNLSNANLEQATKLEEYTELKKRYQELDQRYNALLQMYGEKVEEVQELRLDLSDIKDLYKSQIDELLSKR